MATQTASTDDRALHDIDRGGTHMGMLQASELLAASWGASWAPDTHAARLWFDGEGDRPPEDERERRPEPWDVTPAFARLDTRHTEATCRHRVR